VKLLVYFLIGGTVVTAVTYVGGSGRSLLSAFIATFPAITLLTLSFIHLEAGSQSAADYVRGLLFFAPAWFCYLISLLFFLPRLGLWQTIASSLAVFLVGIAVTRFALRFF
jgi:uncharacterized membrane protein (GlpM family)